jgi:predicted nucleic acid-binding protein
MNIISDTNVVMAVALDEPERSAIVAATRSVELLAPEILPYEIGNALSSLFKRGLLTSLQMQSAWAATQQIPVEYRSVDIQRAFKIAAEHKIYAYDAYFLECAIQCRCPLLTLDTKMRSVARMLKVELITIGDL